MIIFIYQFYKKQLAVFMSRFSKGDYIIVQHTLDFFHLKRIKPR